MKRTLKTMDSVAYVVLALGMAGALTLVYGPRGATKDDCHIPSAGHRFMKVTEVPKRKECICRELLPKLLRERIRRSYHIRNKLNVWFNTVGELSFDTMGGFGPLFLYK